QPEDTPPLLRRRLWKVAASWTRLRAHQRAWTYSGFANDIRRARGRPGIPFYRRHRMAYGRSAEYPRKGRALDSGRRKHFGRSIELAEWSLQDGKEFVHHRQSR